MAASPDGKAIFAYDQIYKVLYKSIDGGKTWGTSAAVALVGVPVVNGLRVSPNFATDNVVVLVEPLHVWMSINGGATFVDVANLDLAAKLGAATVTSVDIGQWYSTNTLTILIGAAGALGTATSHVLSFTYGGFSWASVGALGAGFDVYGVEFSSSHLTDAEILCVYYNAGSISLSSKFGALAWGNLAYPDKVIVASAAAPTSAIIALASDYAGNTGAAIFVGTQGLTAPANNLYRITGRIGAAGTVASEAVIGAGVDFPVQSVAITGPIASATVFAGSAVAASNQIYRSTTATAATPVWTAASRPPTGVTANVATVGTVVFAGTAGADSAVSVSNDAGVSFQQVGLIDTTVLAGGLLQVALVDLKIVDANTMFLVMANTNAAAVIRQYVFKTTDAGVSWQRIYTSLVAVGVQPLMVAPSGAYATDATVVISDGTPNLQKSVTGGAVFGVVGTPAAAITSVFALDTNNIYVGTLAGVYKVGRWAISAPAFAAGSVVSIALNPKDTTKATFMVGTSAGTVYQSTNDGVSFAQVGVGAVPAAANIIVKYGADGTLYAADSAAGAFRWTGTAWLAIQAATGSGLAVTPDGSLYMASSTAGVSIWRSLKPTAATAALCEFQQLNYAAAAFPATGILSNLAVISGASANSIYAMETNPAGVSTSYLYAGRVYGFSDILITAAAKGTPANAALLTTVTSATISWTAITGATGYSYILDTAAEAATAPAGSTSVAFPALTFTGGTTHTWSYRVTAPIFGRTSGPFTFTTALPVVTPGGPIGIVPTNGGVDVAIDSTFSWPVVAGATSYEFVIAEDLGNVDPFAIIDYSATTLTNAHKLRENLKYNTVYYWRVRPVNATIKGDWTTGFFTTVKEPVVTTTTAPPPVVITSTPPPVISLEIPPSPTPVNVIPTYLLWAVIAVGAVLVIVVIVLIVRTRRIS